MIGIDTNVLVRFLVQDDPAQSKLATDFIDGLTAEEPGYISTVALVETMWVLARSYEKSRDQLSLAIEGLLSAEDLIVEDADIHHRALAIFDSSPLDYSDAVIAQSCRRAGCDRTLTFDRRAAAGAGMTLLTTKGLIRTAPALPTVSRGAISPASFALET